METRSSNRLRPSPLPNVRPANGTPMLSAADLHARLAPRRRCRSETLSTANAHSIQLHGTAVEGKTFDDLSDSGAHLQRKIQLQPLSHKIRAQLLQQHQLQLQQQHLHQHNNESPAAKFTVDAVLRNQEAAKNIFSCQAQQQAGGAVDAAASSSPNRPHRRQTPAAVNPASTALSQRQQQQKKENLASDGGSRQARLHEFEQQQQRLSSLPFSGSFDREDPQRPQQQRSPNMQRRQTNSYEIMTRSGARKPITTSAAAAAAAAADSAKRRIRSRSESEHNERRQPPNGHSFNALPSATATVNQRAPAMQSARRNNEVSICLGSI